MFPLASLVVAVVVLVNVESHDSSAECCPSPPRLRSVLPGVAAQRRQQQQQRQRIVSAVVSSSFLASLFSHEANAARASSTARTAA